MRGFAIGSAARVAFACALLALTTPACGKRVEECNRLVEKINGAIRVQTEMTDTQTSKGTSDAAAKFEAAMKDLAGVPLDDPKLKAFQAEYAKILGEMTSALKARAKAIDDKNGPEIQKTAKDVQAAVKDSPALTTSINAYCQGN